MKISIVLLFCVCSVVYLEPVNGENLLGTLFNKAHKVGENLLSAVNLNNKGKGNNNEGVKKQSTEKSEDEVNTGSIKFTTETPAATVNSTPAPSTTPKVSTNNGGDDKKDGREDFAGGCLDGYMRTLDGSLKYIKNEVTSVQNTPIYVKNLWFAPRFLKRESIASLMRNNDETVSPTFTAALLLLYQIFR